MAYLPSTPDATLFDAFKADPHIAHPIHQFSEAVMRGPSPLTPGQRELLAARTSAVNGCHFCRDSHAATARGLDLDADAIAHAIAGAAPEGMPALAPLLAYADKLTRAPAAVAQDDIDAILTAGWGEDAVRHTALVVGMCNLMNRWVEGLGIETDPQTVEAAGTMLARDGYAAVSDLLDADKAA